VALALAHALTAKGHRVSLLLMSAEGELLNEARERFEVVDLKCNRTWKLPLRLTRYLRDHKPDLVISSFWKLNLCACIARLARPATKLLLWEHSPPSLSKQSPSFLYGVSATLFYRLSTGVVCVSGGVRDDVLSLTTGLEKRVRVIHNPIPAPATLPARSARPGPKRLAWIGRLDEPKNPGLMIQTLAQLPNVDLVMAGEGRLRETLEDQARSIGVADRVRFLGYVSDPYTVLVDCDLLVLSSDREGLPGVLVEAMHAGIGVVATDCGAGVREIVDPPQNGLICTRDDPRALADAIMTALARVFEPIGQTERAKLFDPSIAADKFLAFAEI
jgi:glycosyltransferase involved in cell wall biosynthesis